MTGTTFQRLYAAMTAVCPLAAFAIPAAGSATYTTAVQISAAQSTLAAFDWSEAADNAWIAQQTRTAAAGSLGTLSVGLSSAEFIVMRAIVMLVVDQLNILRTKAGLAAITYAQAKTAIGNAIAAGNADS
jgi:hypothetical protein